MVSADPAAAPSGVVTFLFTDIEGSTRRWESDAGAMRAALLAHDNVLRTAIEKHEGFLFSHTGDGVVAAFASPGSAVDAAVAAQRALAGTHGHRHRRGRAARRGLFRHGAQSCGAGDGRRARRPDPGGLAELPASGNSTCSRCTEGRAHRAPTSIPRMGDTAAANPASESGTPSTRRAIHGRTNGRTAPLLCPLGRPHVGLPLEAPAAQGVGGDAMATVDEVGTCTYRKARGRHRACFASLDTYSDVMKERGLRSSCPSRARMLGVLT
jgi:hypothetical protein